MPADHISPATFIIAFASSDTIKAPADANSSFCSKRVCINAPTRSSAVPISSGAACATLVTISAMTSPVLSTSASSPPSLKASCSPWTISWATFTTFFSGVAISSYKEIARPSNPDFRIVICPDKLSFMVSAIF